MQQLPQSPVQTEEIHMGSEGHQASLVSIPEEVPAASAEEVEAKAAADETAPEIPQHVALEAVKTSTANLQPKPQNPHSRKQKLKADDFFAEHHFFTHYIHMTLLDFDASIFGLPAR